MPDIPPGNLRSLMYGLHELHARASWPSTRKMAEGRDFSHTAVYELFTKTQTIPKVGILLDVVEYLATHARPRINSDELLDHFDKLWAAALNEPFASSEPERAAAVNTQAPRRPASRQRAKQTFVINTTDTVLQTQQLLAAISAMRLTVNEISHRGQLRRLFVTEPHGQAFKLNELHALVEAMDGTIETDGAYIGITRSEVEELRSEVNAGEEKAVEANPNARLDLIEMASAEFEDFVRRLFEALGFSDWRTEHITSRYAYLCVDALADNRDPILGGLTLVQAQRYSRPGHVDTHNIRELAELMEETTAERGVLLINSEFSGASATLAKEYGRVELIDGQRLQNLAREHLGIDVIVAPKRSRS